MLLYFAGDVCCEDRLQPLSGTAANDPCVCGGYRASNAGGKLRGSQGKAIFPSHGWIIPAEIKNAMRKIKACDPIRNAYLNAMTATAKIKKFRTKQAAESAVEECYKQGWKAGMRGNSESGWTVDAITTANGYRITYDLHTDGHFHEYSRKEVAL